MQEWDARKLVEEAYAARAYAYAPYSGFCVGAALLSADGRVYRGCNIENAAFSPTNCAERTAFFKAVSEGAKEFAAIAIVGGKEAYLAPCGVCRQVMAEFCDPERFSVILVKNRAEYKIVSLGALLPEAFSKQDFS